MNHTTTLTITVGCHACGALLPVSLQVRFTPVPQEPDEDPMGFSCRVQADPNPALTTFVGAHRMPYMPDRY